MWSAHNKQLPNINHPPQNSVFLATQKIRTVSSYN